MQLISGWKKKFFFLTYKYHVESKVLQYFSNMRYNLVAQDAFVKVVKVTNYTGLTKCASMAWSMAMESTVLGLTDLTWLLKFL